MGILATADVASKILSGVQAGLQAASYKDNPLSSTAIADPKSRADIKHEVGKAFDQMVTAGNVALVETTNPMFSPTMITSIVGILAGIGTVFGLDIDESTKTAIVTALLAIVSVVGIIRKLFGKTVSSTAVSSMKSLG